MRIPHSTIRGCPCAATETQHSHTQINFKKYQQTSLKGQLANIFSFTDCILPVKTVQLCHGHAIVGTDNRHMDEKGGCFNKTLFKDKYKYQLVFMCCEKKNFFFFASFQIFKNVKTGCTKRGQIQSKEHSLQSTVVSKTSCQRGRPVIPS